MSRTAFFLLVSPILFCNMASAQSRDESSQSTSEQGLAEAKKRVDHSKKLNLEDPATVAAAQRDALPANPQLELTRKQALQAIAQNAKRLAELKDGNTFLWEDAVKMLPFVQRKSNLIKQQITRLNNQNLTTPNRKKIEAEIRDQLQVIGQYLQVAPYLKEDRSRTSEQVSKIDQWKQEVESFEANITLKQKGKFQIIGERSSFILLNLPHPIQIQTEPGATVYLTSPTGGNFSNGLSITKIKADQNGIIQDHWISHGFSTGPSPVRVVCPEVGVIDSYQLQVVHLAPLEILTQTAAQIKLLQK